MLLESSTKNWKNENEGSDNSSAVELKTSLILLSAYRKSREVGALSGTSIRLLFWESKVSPSSKNWTINTNPTKTMSKIDTTLMCDECVKINEINMRWD